MNVGPGGPENWHKTEHMCVVYLYSLVRQSVQWGLHCSALNDTAATQRHAVVLRLQAAGFILPSEPAFTWYSLEEKRDREHLGCIEKLVRTMHLPCTNACCALKYLV